MMIIRKANGIFNLIKAYGWSLTRQKGRNTKRFFRVLLCLILIVLQFISCKFPNKIDPVKSNTQATPAIYQMPAVPLMLTTREQQEDFIMEYFWNNFNFKDTSLYLNTKVNEQAFINFISIVKQVSREKAVRGITMLMRRAEVSQKTYLIFFELAEKYLFNPNSPFRNENLYESFLRNALATNAIDPLYKIRIQKQFDTAQKNKPGNKATNFSFTLKDGTSNTLYRIKSKLLLIYFHNPDCSDCKVTRGKIIQSKVIHQLADKGMLCILSLFPDKELTLWQNHYAELPAGWINGYDKGTTIKNNELYDLKAIPTLYLLDGSKTVLLRDATLEEIEKYLIKYN
jgi:hypothetical protein